MSKVKYLVGNEKIISHVLQPYNDLVIEFLNDLSAKLRSDKRALDHPDVLTFAFWCRRANINSLKNELSDKDKRLGLGKIFHITPSNVPINFAYSFAFGLLAGNSNIVRVPSKPYYQVNIITSNLKELFKTKKYNTIKEMTALVTYERSDEITANFSKQCDGRIIWGGDATIRNIRKLPLKERSVEIMFSDRYSISVINPKSINSLNEKELNRLAERFYNDTYLMDQNACSSPHLIVWLGKKDDNAKEKFWKALYKVVDKKYDLELISVSDKYVKFCENAIELKNIKSVKRMNSLIYRTTMNKLPENIEEYRDSCGFFYEYDAQDLNEISHIVNKKYQTVTYFGVEKELIFNFVIKNKLLGIDRIVPIGQALDIGIIWDGYDIIRSLSRVIQVV